MFYRIIFYALLLAALPVASHAGEVTIKETDTAITVEYSGENDADVIAAKIARAREEKQEEIDAERRRMKIEQSLARKVAKEAARNAPGAPREERKEEEE